MLMNVSVSKSKLAMFLPPDQPSSPLASAGTTHHKQVCYNHQPPSRKPHIVSVANRISSSHSVSLVGIVTPFSTSVPPSHTDLAPTCISWHNETSSKTTVTSRSSPLLHATPVRRSARSTMAVQPSAQRKVLSRRRTACQARIRGAKEATMACATRREEDGR